MVQPPTTARSIQTDTDPLTVHELRLLASAAGPCVSIHLPTHRRGADVRQNPVRLRNLIDAAVHRLRDADVSTATIDSILAPSRALLDDDPFWQHQADGLSIFAAPDLHLEHRLAIPVAESVSVGSTFDVAPLVSLLSGDGSFRVLALSQNSVRLFDATRSTMTELDTGSMPTSIATALEHEDPERQLQFRSGGGGSDAQFHGHGAGQDYDKATVERYLRAVDHGLRDVIGADTAPLVLACVAYYVPIFRSVSHHHDIVEQAVIGNPEHAQLGDLHAAAWELVAPRFCAGTERAKERYRAALGTGDAVESLPEIATCAAEGRVATLLVDPAALVAGTDDPEPGAQLNRAILDTVNASGEVVTAAGTLSPGASVGALLRY